MLFTTAPSACIQCRYSLAPKDWTCPQCGAIVDRYLFSTVTRKSLEGDNLNAYESGYQHCQAQIRQTGKTAIRPENYHPVRGRETAYRAGWQRAAEQHSDKADRKFGRRRGAIVFATGVLLLAGGLVIAYGTGQASGGTLMYFSEPLFGAGGLSVAIGLGMLITGSNDEVRPDAE